MSIFAWIAFSICAAAVALHYLMVGDARFLLYAVPSVAMLLIIPLVLAWMSRKSFAKASKEYTKKARLLKIVKINNGMIGHALKITGEVRKISFRWLNRPHFHVEDETGSIRVIMFTAPADEVKVGDRVEVLGVVMRNLFKKTTTVISAVSITKSKTD